MQTVDSLPILDAQGITKRFGAVVALKDALNLPGPYIYYRLRQLP